MTASAPPPDSPCVGICRLHPETGRCIGCHRTAEEIRTHGEKFAQWQAKNLPR
jgi:predicted Fe-S protein YdhL (DUF1289 family)